MRHRLTEPEKAGLLIWFRSSVVSGESKTLEFRSEAEAKAAFSFLKRMLSSSPAVAKEKP